MPTFPPDPDRTDLPAASPTSLRALPALAASIGVAQVFVKCEGERALGNFKTLGGTRAARQALLRITGAADAAALAALRGAGQALPRLLCASAGNHGLAVANAARAFGAPARVYLPATTPALRCERIAASGAELALIDASYDDAVEAAAAAAARGDGLLIPDTSADPQDRVVRDVMAGYAQIAREVLAQVDTPPTHLYVQAGVGGLAAGLAEGFGADPDAWTMRVIVVEPASAACVAAALAHGRPVRLPPDGRSVAEMLDCALASAPAVETLRRAGAQAIPVAEDALLDAVRGLREAGGPPTTPSGAAGLAGLLKAAADPATRERHGLAATSRVLLIASEAEPAALAARGHSPNA